MSARYRLLARHKSKLEDFLEGANLSELSEEFLKHQIINKEFHNRFSSLDPDPHHLKSDIKVRYLLQQVCERVREDGEVFDRLVRVLARLGGEDLRVESEVMKKELRQIEGREGASGADKGGERYLAEQDVSDLVEALVSGSHLWDAIGIALNLPKHKRVDCGKGEEESVCKLSNILTTWISGCYEGARPATLSRLKSALTSKTVGLGRLTQKLSQLESHIEEESIVQQENYPIKPDIIFQTYDTKVAESKSTLLEVQVNCCGSESYQWSKDGEPLLNGADFSGVCSNTLYINKSSRSMEGKYSCCINQDIKTHEMCLSVIYPVEKKELVEFYLMKREVPQDSWPPVGNSTFINLVLIEQKQRPMSTCDYYTIRGDMDDILESKEVAGYNEVFREYREGALVLIEGRPGSGKTTLVHKLSRDWAREKIFLKGAKMVFLVTLRLLNASEKDKSLRDLLEVYYSEDLSRKIEHDLKECKGRGACFILDGLDEYPIESKNKLVIDQLLFTETFLPHSMVIVASRPVATGKLRKTCKMRIEVVGFSKDQIYNYVSSYPFSDSSSSMPGKMAKYLDMHPNVLHMCYLPVHASMICFLFSDLEGNIPHRETQIYEQFTISTLLRHKAKVERTQIKSLKDLYGEEKKLFNSICKLAFDMIMNSQQVVSKSDAKVSFSNDSVFGLLTVESTSKRYGTEDFYTFHHLTLQEFLAAFYVLEAQLESCWLRGDYNVSKFYCGLGGSSNIEACKTILLAPHFNNLFLKAQCAYESQQGELCDYVINDGVLKLHNDVISSTDFIALGYVISNTSKLVEKISIQSCWLDSEGVKIFCSVVDEKKLKSMKCLTVNQNNDQEIFSDQEIQTLNCFLKHMSIFEELDLIRVNLSISKINELTRNVQLPHLKVLKISIHCEKYSYPEDILKLLAFGSRDIRKIYFSVEKRLIINDAAWRKIVNYAFGCQEIQMIESSLINLHNLNKCSTLLPAKLSRCFDIILVNCGIGNEELDILANTLNTSLLTNLVLDFNKIGDSGAIALADFLERCSVVQEVSIQCNSIGDSGATALADALVHCSGLRKLDLQGNSLGDRGAVTIAKATKNLSGLDLYLYNINITEEGIERVLEHRVSTNIREIKSSLYWHNISQSGIKTLKHALCCGNIPQLELSSTNINNFEELIVDEGLKFIGALDVSLNDEDVPTLCRIINSLTTLNYVKCYLHGITSTDALQLLCDCLGEKSSINKLHLSNMRDSSIFNMIKQQTKFSYLGVSHSKIKLEYLILFLLKSASNLHSLVLDHCNIRSFTTHALGQGLALCKNLRYLDLSHNIISDFGMIALTKALKHHTSLLKLSLGYNRISLLGYMSAFIPVIANNNLQYISFAGNPIRSGAATLVIATCKHSLQYLNLTDTAFGKFINAIAIVSIGLTVCKRLKELHIDNNFIGSSGLAVLTKGLQHCTNLQMLYLDSNGIKADGVAAMLPVMKYCKYLKYLGFSKNYIGVRGAAVLVGGWCHKSPLTIDLLNCFDSSHESALLNVKKCCSECDHLLELYYNNDYVHIKIDCYRSVPKLVIF